VEPYPLLDLKNGGLPQERRSRAKGGGKAKAYCLPVAAKKGKGGKTEEKGEPSTRKGGKKRGEIGSPFIRPGRGRGEKQTASIRMGRGRRREGEGWPFIPSVHPFSHGPGEKKWEKKKKRERK